MWHPNGELSPGCWPYSFLNTTELCFGPVYNDGRVCISILHSPGDDPHGYETASERWSPVQSVRDLIIANGNNS